MNRTFNVEISLPANSNLHPNMVAVIKIADYSNPSTFVLPANVVQMTDEGTYVFVAENNIAKKKNVNEKAFFTRTKINGNRNY